MSATFPTPVSPNTIFISYSHDSDEHRDKVLGFSERLRNDGLNATLDQYVDGSPEEGWPRWMLNQLEAARFVLVVCTETYYRRFRGHEMPGKGKGVDWEGAIITQEIYSNRSRTLKFVPVLFSTEAENWIPEPLRVITCYDLTSEATYQKLYDFLVGQAGVEPGPIGPLKTRSRRTAKPLRFDRVADAPSTFEAPHEPPLEQVVSKLNFSEAAEPELSSGIAGILRSAQSVLLSQSLSVAGIDQTAKLFRAMGARLTATTLMKLQQDIEHGCLGSRASISYGRKVSLSNLARATLIPANLSSPWFPEYIQALEEMLPTEAFDGQISDSSRALIANMASDRPDGKILFDAQALHTGLIATVAALQRRFALPVTVRIDALDGREQFTRLNREDDSADIVICANANMFTLGKQGAVDRYTYFATFILQPQYIVLGRNSSPHARKELIYAEGSSGEEQLRIQKGLLAPYISGKPRQIEFALLPETLTTLDKDQALICWDPLVSYLSPPLGHQIRRSNRYEIATSLYSHHRWNTPDKRASLAALYEAIVAAWKIVCSNVVYAAVDLTMNRTFIETLKNSILLTDEFGFDSRI